MRRVSSRVAEKKFYSVLSDADKAPVIIERHGRPRAAVVSYRQFRLYETILSDLAEQAALDRMEESVQMLADGRLGKASRALKEARALSRRAAASTGIAE